jgi:hypothetical protein
VTVGAGHSAAGVDQRPPEPGPPGKRWRLALICLVGVFALLACYDLIVMDGHFGSHDVAAASGKATPASKAAQAGAGHGSLPSSAATPASPASPATASPATGKTATGSVPAAVPQSLGVTSVAAFGPEGISDGDNPAIASRILNVSTDQPWYSQWYATPEFGNLRSGTGLLLDMGETASVTSAQLALGAVPGADVQVLVGNDADLADMSPVASAWGVGGTVRLTATTAARGRYVLIWFTRLPPKSQGEYQVDVYSVTINGTEGG